jgi:hypothetical protein
MVLNKIPTFQEVKDWANGTFTTLSEVNNNADVQNADYEDNAGDADTVDGKHASDIGKSNSQIRSAVYQTVASGTVNREVTSGVLGFSVQDDVGTGGGYVKAQLRDYTGSNDPITLYQDTGSYSSVPQMTLFIRNRHTGDYSFKCDWELVTLQ